MKLIKPATAHGRSFRSVLAAPLNLGKQFPNSDPAGRRVRIALKRRSQRDYPPPGGSAWVPSCTLADLGTLVDFHGTLAHSVTFTVSGGQSGSTIGRHNGSNSKTDLVFYARGANVTVRVVTVLVLG